MKGDKIILVKNLSKFYDKFQAISDISLEVKEGEIFGLLGPNGAGKTTLIGVLSTLLKINEGIVVVNGYDIKKSSGKVRESIGIIFQETVLDLELNSIQNLDFHGRLYKIPKKLKEKKIKELLDLVGLWEYRKKRVEEFSGGMKRRLEIARGLLHNPKILFLDEPTLGLDPQTRRHVWKYIMELKEKEGMTILLTTHYMDEADYLCDRVAIMDHGNIVVVGKPGDLKSRLEGDVVKIKLNKIDKVFLEKLKKLDFVKNVNKIDNTIELIVKNAESKIMKLIDLIKKSKKEIIEISMYKPNLEDVFLKFTGREMKND